MRDDWESPAAVARHTREGLRPGEARLISRLFGPTGDLLDLGCGTGRTAAVLRERGHRVTAIDISWSMVCEARQRAPGLRVLEMDAAELAFRDATFDYALFSFNGLDYIYPYARRIRALREVRRVLRPGGWLIYSSHNSLCLLLGPKRWRTVVSNWRAGRTFFFSRYRLEVYDYAQLLTCFTHPLRELWMLRRLGYAGAGVDTDRSDGRRDLRAILASGWLYYAARVLG